MEIVIERHTRVGDGIPSECFVDGQHYSWSLENASHAIPSGRYRVIVTPSARASSGQLWAPTADYLLPLLQGVPNRDGIRIHAANFPDELEGCIALGQSIQGAHLYSSQMVVRPFLYLLLGALRVQQPIWITVKDAPKVNVV